MAGAQGAKLQGQRNGVAEIMKKKPIYKISTYSSGKPFYLKLPLGLEHKIGT